MSRTITREEAKSLGNLAWFIRVRGKIVYKTNVRNPVNRALRLERALYGSYAR